MTDPDHHHHHAAHGTAHEKPGKPGYSEHNEQRAGGHGDHGPAHPPNSQLPTPHSHDKHAGHSVAMFRDKFWLTLLLTIPTLVWGHMLPGLLGVHAPAFPGSQ